MAKLKADVRKQQILEAAVKVAERDGYSNILRREVANEAKCGEGTVSHYFGTMPQLHRAVMRKAIQDKNLKLIAEGLAARDHNAMKASAELKQAAMELMLTCSTNS